MKPESNPVCSSEHYTMSTHQLYILQWILVIHLRQIHHLVALDISCLYHRIWQRWSLQANLQDRLSSTPLQKQVIYSINTAVMRQKIEAKANAAGDWELFAELLMLLLSLHYRMNKWYRRRLLQPIVQKFSQNNSPSRQCVGSFQKTFHARTALHCRMQMMF